MRRPLTLLALAGLCAAGTLASAAPRRAAKPPPDPGEPPLVDVSNLKQLMHVYHDGKGHTVAVVPIDAPRVRFALFYSRDGKVFYQQVVQAWESNRDIVQYVIQDPRVLIAGDSQLRTTKTGAELRCDKRKTPLVRLEAPKAAALLDAATFRDIYWRRISHLLARDDEGNYYYVDRGRSTGPTEILDPRVFVGPKGKMRLVRMRNIVNDVAGQIFITRAGTLRLIVDRRPQGKPSARWIVGRRERALTIVDVEDRRTVVMVYRELGLFSGQQLRRPCDDF